MDEQKGSGYRIENIILTESVFQRKSQIAFDGTPISNDIKIDKEAADGVDESRFSVSLTLTLTATQEEEVAYSIKVRMVGLFEKHGETPLSIDAFKNINAPAILYPFVREHVSSLTLKAGIGNVILPSVNFKI